MPLNRMYKDMAENFPLIYASQVSAYWEDYADYENGYKPVRIKNKKSRNTVKRSSKQSAASKNRHRLEKEINFEMPALPKQKGKNLVIPIVWESEIRVYAKIPSIQAEFYLDWNHKEQLWIASSSLNSWQIGDANIFRALARLLDKAWIQHKYSGTEISFYGLFDKITFDYGQKPNLRNRTRHIEMPNCPDFRLSF